MKVRIPREFHVQPSFDESGLIKHWPTGCRPAEERRTSANADVGKVAGLLAVALVIVAAVTLAWLRLVLH
jgi:hypothetical protein